MMTMSGFPVDSETLDLLAASIANPGAESSSLFGVLGFLSNGDLEPHHHNDQCREVADGFWDCSEGMAPQFSPHDVILALIDEVRLLRSGKS